MEGLWDEGEERPLSSYGHCSGIVHGHMWRPTVSHPNVRYGRAGFDLQHDAEMVVLATLGVSNNEWHTGEKGVVHLGDVLSTNEGATGLPFAVQLGSFSFTPTVHNNS